ncbi:MAG: fused MFS/spermidine synthase [Endomicrobiales bacterium]|nr:fused MFS/spermidine synthase [Endomicrobiales bacterium]
MRRSQNQKLIILSAFFLSGFAALVYEILWTRALSLHFGHTTVAISAVLAAYMAGLSLGSHVSGRISDRIKHDSLLHAYALLEILVALSALLSLPAIKLLSSSFVFAGVTAASVPAQSIIWFTGSFIPLLAPTFLMGATLPVLSRWLSILKSDGETGKSVGLLYGANTAGAVLGTAAAGFFLVPILGTTKTFFFAAIFNVISAGLAVLASQNLPNPKSFFEKVTSAIREKSEETPLRGRTAGIAVIFLTGFAAMACEVAWTRAFASILGSSTYAFTIMLLTFLLGIALGSLFFSYLRNHFEVDFSGLAVVVFFAALSIVFYSPFMNMLPYYYVRLFPLILTWVHFTHLIQFILCASIMFLPTFFMGLIFPWIISALNPGTERSGDATGSVYAWNTLGNILGSGFAGLLMIHSIGTENTLMVSAFIYAAAAALCVFALGAARIHKKVFLSTAILVFTGAVIFFRPPWDPAVIASGAFLYASECQGQKTYKEFRNAMQFSKVIYYKDGISASVAVFQSAWGDRFLRINGKTDASTGIDMITQILQGYLPYILHRGSPESALVVGLGSGVTSGCIASLKEINKVDCVEIEPAVKGASVFFSKYNNYVLENPKLKLIFTDARQYLSAPGQQYDIITSEPSNPWIAGNAALFTAEAFELAKKRLKPYGVFCQWFHSYSMGRDDFKMVLKTFASVFPHVILFHTSDTDYFLCGSNESWVIDYQKLCEKFADNPEMQKNLNYLGLNHPFTLLATTFLLTDSEFREFSDDSEVHRDDRPVLEFSAPMYLHMSEHALVTNEIMSIKKSLFPDSLSNYEWSDSEKETLYNMTGEAFLRGKKLDSAELAFNEALKIRKNNPRTITNLGRVENLKDNHLLSEKYFREAVKIDPKYPLAWFHLGMLYIVQNMEDEGLEYLKKGLDANPGDPMGSLYVARLYKKKGRIKDAKSILGKALSGKTMNRDMRRALEAEFLSINGQNPSKQAAPAAETDQL